MPWTLYRYILRDVVKVLALATLVLVLLIAFAMAIKPLADGLLEPLTLAKFVGVMMPTALGFALPFAGAFASTIVFVRLAADNEITAAAASGVSYAKILMPVLALGLVLTMGLFALSNTIIPKFYRWGAATLQRDLITAMVGQLNENRPFEMESQGLVIYADQANIEPPPTLPEARIQPSKLVELDGVAAAKLGPQKNVEGEATAERASVLLFRGQQQSWISMRLRNVLVYKAAQQQFDRLMNRELDLRMRLNRPFKDDPEYLSYSELEQLRDQPRRFDRVQNRMQELAQTLARAKLTRLMRQRLTGQQQPAMLELAGPREGEQYVITAPTVQRDGQTLTLTDGPQTPVRVAYRKGGRILRRYEANRATVTLSQAQQQGAAQAMGLGQANQAHRPIIDLQLQQVRIQDADAGGPPSEKASHALPRMTWPGPIFDQTEMALAQPATLRVEALKDIARLEPYRQLQAVRGAWDQLNEALRHLGFQIAAQFHQRAASAVACLLLLLLGAVLSMQLTGQMTLVVYLWSFLLAVFTLIIINSGEHMASSGDYALGLSLMVMWAGNLSLSIVIGVMYCRLARH
jgi:lipopolysaccharide export system permease protein